MTNLKVRFVKQYTLNGSGNVFRRYQSDDGRTVEIRIRAGRHGRITHTNAEAKQAAVNLLTGRFTVVDLERGEYGIYDHHHERFINR